MQTIAGGTTSRVLPASGGANRPLCLLLFVTLFGPLLFNYWFWSYDVATGYDHMLFAVLYGVVLAVLAVTGNFWSFMPTRKIVAVTGAFVAASVLAAAWSSDRSRSAAYLGLWLAYISVTVVVTRICRTEEGLGIALWVQKAALACFAGHVLFNYVVHHGDGYTFRDHYHLAINDMAILFGLPFAFMLSQWVGQRSVGWTDPCLCLLALAAALVSGSRSSIILLGAIGAYVLLRNRHQGGRVTMLAMLIGLLGLVVVAQRSDYLADRFTGILEGREEAKVAGRFEIYELYFDMARQVWTTGVGLGVWDNIYEYVDVENYWGGSMRSSHSLYLKLVIEGGVLLLAAFLLLLVQARIKLSREQQTRLLAEHPELFHLQVAAHAYLLAMFVNAAVNEGMLRWYFWCNLGLVLAVHHLITTRFAAETKPMAPAPRLLTSKLERNRRVASHASR